MASHRSLKPQEVGPPPPPRSHSATSVAQMVRRPFWCEFNLVACMVCTNKVAPEHEQQEGRSGLRWCEGDTTWSERKDFRLEKRWSIHLKRGLARWRLGRSGQIVSARSDYFILCVMITPSLVRIHTIDSRVEDWKDWEDGGWRGWKGASHWSIQVFALWLTKVAIDRRLRRVFGLKKLFPANNSTYELWAGWVITILHLLLLRDPKVIYFLTF